MSATVAPLKATESMCALQARDFTARLNRASLACHSLEAKPNQLRYASERRLSPQAHLVECDAWSAVAPAPAGFRRAVFRQRAPHAHCSGRRRLRGAGSLVCRRIVGHGSWARGRLRRALIHNRPMRCGTMLMRHDA